MKGRGHPGFPPPTPGGHSRLGRHQGKLGRGEVQGSDSQRDQLLSGSAALSLFICGMGWLLCRHHGELRRLAECQELPSKSHQVSGRAGPEGPHARQEVGQQWTPGRTASYPGGTGSSAPWGLGLRKGCWTET